MDDQQRSAIEEELAKLRERVENLEQDLAPETRPHASRTFYAAYYATTGFLLGIFGGAVSLLVNIVGSALIGQHPLKLIQIYLTFPLGDRALDGRFLDYSGMLLAVGCCLYLATGMLLGIIFQLAFGWLAHDYKLRGLTVRLIAGTLLGVAVWIVNFYCILSWLQPAIVGGENTIVSLVPWYVGMLTHLVYGWTMAVVYPLGEYQPYHLPLE